jgi:hypothetical protein
MNNDMYSYETEFDYDKPTLDTADKLKSDADELLSKLQVYNRLAMVTSI